MTPTPGDDNQPVDPEATRLPVGGEDPEGTKWRPESEDPEGTKWRPESEDPEGTRWKPGTGEATPTGSYTPSFAPGRHFQPGRFGEYELLAEIARGGMGVVYKAKHVSNGRVVALKMIPPGNLASADDVQRFHNETQAASRLDHPHIVPVYEIGEAAGQHYFTMALATGGSLQQRVREGPLPPREAARLVQQIAEAVQQAHNQGILHRDIKPHNILLFTGDTQSRNDSPGASKPGTSGQATVPVPRLADFGLARLREDSEMTRTGQFLGTPSYMPPEQTRMDRTQVGPASDVYGLGAVLYCLLTGRPPFQSADPVETMRQVRVEEPVPVRSLNTAVPQDLESVCLRCLSKEPKRRYATAQELANDLGRYLTGAPTEARPVTTLERGWRWCRRNPAVAPLLLLVVLSLLGGILGMTVLYFRAEEQRGQAELAKVDAQVETLRANREKDKASHFATEADRQRREADKQRDAAQDQANRARQVSRMLTGMFDASDPVGLNGLTFGLNNRAGQNLMARDLLERALKLTEEDAKLVPVAKAEVYHAVGNVYRSIGLYKNAEPLLLKALEIRKAHGAAPTDLAASLHALAWLDHERGDYPKAEVLYREALRIHAQSPSQDAVAVLNTQFNLAWLLTEMNDMENAEDLFKEVLAKRIKLLSEEHRDTLLARGGLAALYLDLNKPLSAMPLVAKSLDTLKRLGIDQNILNAAAQFQQAVILEQGFGNLAGAEKLLRESEQVIRKALGPRHLYVTMPLTQLGMVQELRKNDDEAMTSYTEALEIARDTVGLAHPKVLIIVERLSAIYRRKKQADKVTALFKELLEAKRERYGDNHVFVADTLQLLASHEFEMGNFVQEERLLKEALAIYQASGNRPPRLYGVCLNLRGTNLCRRKQYAASEGYFRDAIKVNRQLHRKAHPDLAQAQLNLVFSLFQQKQYTEEAEGLLHEVDQLLPALQESDQTRLRHGWVVRSTDLLCQRKGGHEQAAHLLDRFLSSSKESTQVEAFAIGYVACLKALSQDSTIPGEKRTPLEAHYSVSAVKCFRQAWKLAPERRFAWIETPPPELKERAEFQMLLAEIRKSKT